MAVTKLPGLVPLKHTCRLLHFRPFWVPSFNSLLLLSEQDWTLRSNHQRPNTSKPSQAWQVLSSLILHYFVVCPLQALRSHTTWMAHDYIYHVQRLRPMLFPPYFQLPSQMVAESVPALHSHAQFGDACDRDFNGRRFVGIASSELLVVIIFQHHNMEVDAGTSSRSGAGDTAKTARLSSTNTFPVSA